MKSQKNPPESETKKFWRDLEEFIQITGESSTLHEVPGKCPECSCKEFYKQSDFKRQLGLISIGIASISTMILMSMGFNWFIIWSPMLIMLIFDRVLFRIRPTVLICYQCKHVFRGLSEEILAPIEAFDLVIHDRFKYKEGTDK